MKRYVHVVSDATGATAEQLVRSALTQFEGTEVEIVRHGGVRSAEQIEAVVREAASHDGLIVHTLVADEMRQAMLEIGRRFDVRTMDSIGPLLARLTHLLHLSPAEKPGLFRQLDEDYFRRWETVEFAYRHDDSQNVHEVVQAEIVLLGVSRTGKTPLSIYLAFRGWLVANVAIVPGIPLPPQVERLPSGRIVGLTVAPRRLTALRRVRAERLGVDREGGDYTDLLAVRSEVDYALDLYRRHPEWPVLDVTDKPIEETGAEVLTLLNKQRRT